MKTYTLQLQLKSPTLVGAGEGFGATIDSDVVFDEVGLPFIPAKRIKGCLRDAAQEVKGMFHLAAPNDGAYELDVDNAFGTPGAQHSAPVYFSNLKLDDHAQNTKWLSYFFKQKTYGDIFSREKILATFAEIRQQTAINHETGVADAHSLRTIRVLKQGLAFSGAIRIENETNRQKILAILLFACANFRNFGTKRNRGFGEVCCRLLENGETISIEDSWKEVVACTT